MLLQKDYKRINPLDFVEKDLPIIMFVEDRQGFFGWIVRWHSKDNYNHAAWVSKLGRVATQNLTGYKEVSLKSYLKERNFIKFYQFNPVDRAEIDTIKKQIEKDLSKPWYSRRYDFLGLIGQAINVRWIQSPFGKFCSESVANNLRLIPRLRKVIPKRPNPSELNQILKTLPDFKLLGYWWEE